MAVEDVLELLGWSAAVSLEQWGIQSADQRLKGWLDWVEMALMVELVDQLEDSRGNLQQSWNSIFQVSMVTANVHDQWSIRHREVGVDKLSLGSVLLLVGS